MVITLMVTKRYGGTLMGDYQREGLITFPFFLYKLKGCYQNMITPLTPRKETNTYYLSIPKFVLAILSIICAIDALSYAHITR
jgi:hypothetical protein